MEKAIVSGSTGFIGSVLVRLLANKNIPVLALSRTPFEQLDPHRLTLTDNVTYVNVDMSEISSLPSLIRDIGWNPGESCIFFNLAWGGATKLSDLDIKHQINNVPMAINSFAASSEIGCKRFIHVGSMEEVFTSKYLHLDHHIDSAYNRHVIYSIAKTAARNALKYYGFDSPTEIIFATNSHVMGPLDNKDSFLQVTLRKLIDGDKLQFSTGEQIFDVISVNDCARAYLAIAMYGTPFREYWIGSGQPRPLRQYVEIMASLFPSQQPLQFGAMPYNDISLSISDFSIEMLTSDTNFQPLDQYEDIVRMLHSWIVETNWHPVKTS